MFSSAAHAPYLCSKLHLASWLIKGQLAYPSILEELTGDHLLADYSRASRYVCMVTEQILGILQ